MPSATLRPALELRIEPPVYLSLRGRTAGALVRYLLAFAVSYGVNVGVLVIFTAVLGQSSVLSRAGRMQLYHRLLCPQPMGGLRLSGRGSPDESSRIFCIAHGGRPVRSFILEWSTCVGRGIRQPSACKGSNVEHLCHRTLLQWRGWGK